MFLIALVKIDYVFSPKSVLHVVGVAVYKRFFKPIRFLFFLDCARTSHIGKALMGAEILCNTFLTDMANLFILTGKIKAIKRKP